MTVRFVTLDDHETIAAWFKAHGEVIPSLPTIGRMVDDVAAGFLIGTDTNMALLDGYVTNPNASPRSRDQALDLITRALVEAAEVGGFKRVVGLTQQETIARRAIERHGFTSFGPVRGVLKEL